MACLWKSLGYPPLARLALLLQGPRPGRGAAAAVVPPSPQVVAAVVVVVVVVAVEGHTAGQTGWSTAVGTVAHTGSRGWTGSCCCCCYQEGRRVPAVVVAVAAESAGFDMDSLDPAAGRLAAAAAGRPVTETPGHGSQHRRPGGLPGGERPRFPGPPGDPCQA